VTANDEAALRLAVELARQQDRGRREQIDSMLQDRPWQAVAEFCAYVCQTHLMDLRPWEVAPCSVSSVEVGLLSPPADDPRRRHAAAVLVQKMQTLGISKWHPDPVGAIAEAEAKGVGGCPL
jgi:hypothetical protein